MADKKFDLSEFLSQRSKSEKVLGFAAGLLIFIALMQGFVIGPILSKMRVIDEDITSTREEIRRDRRILSFKERILEEYSKSSGYLDSIDKSAEEIIAKLLKKIESTAKEKSISVKDIRPGETEVKPQFQIYKTSIDCEGTLADLLGFMTALEQSEYLFQIIRYSFAPKSKGADLLKASMDIARYLIPMENLGSAALPAPNAVASEFASSDLDAISLEESPDSSFAVHEGAL